jgi:hypothetical protein
MASKSCLTCVHAYPIPGTDWVECRRFPPIDASSTKSGFPTAHNDAWCGEFKLQIPAVKVTESL